jgi:hypothetical protein
MDPLQLEELYNLLSEFTRVSPFEMGSDEDRTLWEALEIINDQL